MAFALQTEKLCKSFGALTVAEQIDFRLEPGARHALIGPNGAGKTTFVNMLTGAIAPTSGKIFLNDQEVTRTSQAARVRLGLGRTFQITTLFRSLPVLDNIALAVAERRGDAQRMWRPASAHREIIDESLELLATLGLADDAAAAAQDLPYGKQRLLSCPYDPKPKCKDCETHCYRPKYREKVKEIMKFSGMHFVKRGRIDWLIKYFTQ